MACTAKHSMNLKSPTAVLSLLTKNLKLAKAKAGLGCYQALHLVDHGKYVEFT